jgi:hypothetical protein
MPTMFDLKQAISDNVNGTLLTPDTMGRELDRLLDKPAKTVKVVYGPRPDGVEVEFLVRYGSNTFPLDFEMWALLLSLDDFSREYLQPIADKIRLIDKAN